MTPRPKIQKLAAWRPIKGICAFWPLGGPQVIVQNGKNRPRPAPGTFLLADGPPSHHFRPQVLNWCKEAGFDHIRVQYEPLTIMWAIENNDQVLLNWVLDYFEETCRLILDGGLGVCLSGILANYADVMRFESVFAGMNAPRYQIYKEHLRQLCRRFADTDPEQFCIELLNEPVANGSTVVRDSPNWHIGYIGNWETDYQPDLYALYRQELPNHTAILTSDGWSNWETLTQLVPTETMLADHNIIWTYHPLFPTPASLAGYIYNQYFYIQRLHYPPGAGGQTEAEAVAHMESLIEKYPDVSTNGNIEGTRNGLRFDLNMYFNQPQGFEWILERVMATTNWARKYGIPAGNVYAGEWGATRDSTGFPGNILGSPVGSEAEKRIDRIHLHRDMCRAFRIAGQRHAVDHLDTLNYGITLAQNNQIGEFDPLIIKSMEMDRARIYDF